MSRTSTVRLLVNKALVDRGTTFDAFVSNHRARGVSVEDIGEQIRLITGIPIADRTLYRWVQQLEKVS